MLPSASNLFLGMLFRERARQRVLVVSHGGTLRVFRHLLERWTHDEFLERWQSEPVPNCAVTSYTFDPAAKLGTDALVSS